MTYDYLIVGAGLSGSLLSYYLNEKNISHVIIDKGRGVGGRMTSKRFGEVFLNHGTQVIATHPYEKQVWFQNWIKQKWIRKRKSNWSIEVKSSELIKSLLKLDEVILNEEIVFIQPDNELLKLTSSRHQTFLTKKLVLTAPIPQSLQLADLFIPDFFKDQIKTIPYQKKIILFVENFKLLRFSASDLFSIESKNPYHMISLSDEISDELFDKENSEIIHFVFSQITSYFEDLQVNDLYVKKWKYAQPLISLTEEYFQSELKNLFIIGDAFGSKISSPTGRAINSAYKLLTDSDLLR